MGIAALSPRISPAVCIATALFSLSPLTAQVVVNAPVAPEVIYIGHGGTAPGISVIDLNGFGQGTGELSTTNFPANPNIGQVGVVPVLQPGTDSRDAGGAGPMTLTKNSSGDTLLADANSVGVVTDLQIGQPLDLVWNNDNINLNALGSNQTNPLLGVVQQGNSISVAPHPNPPRLVTPSPNPTRGIDGEEPTVTSSSGPLGRVVTTSPPCLPVPPNLLNVGNPRVSGVFYGPQPAPPVPPPPIPFCPFTSRQQVGHFLYALDRSNRQVVALNSNRFTVLATMPFADPRDIALSPNLERLAVASFATGTVSIVDVDPQSPNFHTEIAQTSVGAGPLAMAWQPDGEELLVCNFWDNTVSILSALDFSVRLTVSQHINGPTKIAVTAREVGFGSGKQTYFAYILNSDSSIAVFESGPASVGPDDTVARLTGFPMARALHPELGHLGSGCWIAHEDGFGQGQLSLLRVARDNQAAGGDFGDRPFAVVRRIGGFIPGVRGNDYFSGNDLIDIAFDDVANVGALPDAPTPFPRAAAAAHSSKGQIKIEQGHLLPAVRPRYVFAAIANSGMVNSGNGVIDVFDLESGRKVAVIEATGVATLGSYWRQ